MRLLTNYKTYNNDLYINKFRIQNYMPGWSPFFDYDFKTKMISDSLFYMATIGRSVRIEKQQCWQSHGSQKLRINFITNKRLLGGEHPTLVELANSLDRWTWIELSMRRSLEVAEQSRLLRYMLTRFNNKRFWRRAWTSQQAWTLGFRFDGAGNLGWMRRYRFTKSVRRIWPWRTAAGRRC